MTNRVVTSLRHVRRRAYPWGVGGRMGRGEGEQKEVECVTWHYC